MSSGARVLDLESIGPGRARSTATAGWATCSPVSASRRTSSSRSQTSDTNLLFVHRVLADGDLYYVNNRNDRAEDVDATFRVSGKEAELWHADTGRREPASFRIANGRTTVPLHLEPWGTVFVVFRKPAAALRTNAAEAHRGGDRGRRGIVGRQLPGEPWRSGDDHPRHARVLE